MGMKKEFPTYIDETAMLFDAIAVSGGMRGVQLIVNPDQLLGFVKGALFYIQTRALPRHSAVPFHALLHNG